MGTAVSSSRPARIDRDAAGSQRDMGEVPRIPRRRRWWLLGIAALLAALAGYGNYVLITTQDERVDVLVLIHDVGWGHPINDADLGVAKAVPAQPLASIPVSDRDRVIGQFARSTLSSGTVLTPGQLTEQPVPGPGERLVGLPVKPGHLPSRGLTAGDLVQVVPVAGSAGTDAQQTPASPAAPFRARVLGIGPPDSAGAVTVDVVVGGDAAAAATSAAAGQVVVVQLGPGA